MTKDLRALMSSSSFIDMNLINKTEDHVHVHGPSCNHGHDHDDHDHDHDAEEVAKNDRDGFIGG